MGDVGEQYKGGKAHMLATKQVTDEIWKRPSLLFVCVWGLKVHIRLTCIVINIEVKAIYIYIYIYVHIYVMH